MAVLDRAGPGRAGLRACMTAGGQPTSDDINTRKHGGRAMFVSQSLMPELQWLASLLGAIGNKNLLAQSHTRLLSHLLTHVNGLSRATIWFSILKTLNHLYSNFFMEFIKDPSLVLYSSSYTPLLSVGLLSYLIIQQTTNSGFLS